MERKLASVQIVRDILPIEGADAIEVVVINSWKVVVKKDEFKVGDKVTYFEIDSFLPIKEEFEFLRKSSYKKMGALEGFRLKTIRLRGQVSQGLVTSYNGDADEGTDLTEELGVVKFEPPIPAELSGIAKGNFPSFLIKTDEERIQNLTKEYSEYKTLIFYEAEKLEGCSVTFYVKDGIFGVCSRNIDLLESEGNTFWKVARQLKIEELLKDKGNIALQGELVGEGIQGNIYNLKGQTVYFFNVFNIDTQVYYSYTEFTSFIDNLGLKTVPILSERFILPDTIEELLSRAEGISVLNATEREGIVLRSRNRKVSFKVINNKYLLKQK